MALGLGLWLPLASLPVFAFGFWDKAEPLVVGFHAVAALSSLSLLLAVWCQPQASLKRLCHPYLLLPLALGLWSLLAAIFTPLPILSLLGAPQSGYGALWFLDLAGLIGCALLLADDEANWRRLLFCALTALLVTTILKMWDWLSLRRGQDTLLIYIGAYYGWLALALPLLFRGRRQGWAFAAALMLAVVSESLTIAGLVALWGGASWAHRRGWLRQPGRKLTAGLVLAAAILPWLALHGLPWLLRKESLWDRAMIQNLVLADMGAQPSLLLGHGWGRMADVFRVWLNLSGQRLWAPSWIYLLSDYFHSHHWGLEALYSAGLPALALMLIWFLTLPRYARTEMRFQALGFTVALAVLSGLWFPLALSVPFMALALAGLADDASWQPVWLRGKGWVLLPALLAVGQVTAAAALLTYGLQFGALRQAWETKPPRLAAVPRDFRDGDMALAELIRKQAARYPQQPPSEARIAVIQEMEAAVDLRAETTLTPLLLEAGIELQARLLVTRDLAYAARTGAEEAMLRRWTFRLLELAPGRSDAAIPLFSLWLSQRRLDEVTALAGQLLARDPDDAVGLQFKGLSLLAGGDPARRDEGLRLLRRALDQGIERFIPIDAATKAILGKN